MMTPKQAIIKDGRIPVKEGRGRLSREADARCRELAAEGWVIKGYTVGNAVANSSTPPVVTKTAVTNEKVIADFTIVYAEKSYKAVGNDGKTYGMRECCNNCRVSLVQNHCANPTILGDIPVKIVPV